MAFIDYYQAGQQAKKQRETDVNMKRFGELAGSLPSTQERSPVFAEMAKIDPAGAMKFQDFYGKQDAMAKEQQAAEEKRKATSMLYAVQAVVTAPDPRKKLETMFPEFLRQIQAEGFDPDSDRIRAWAEQQMPALYEKAGVQMPAPQQAEPLMTEEGPYGSKIVRQGGRFQVIQPPQAAAPKPKYELRTKQLPDGSTQQFRVDVNNPEDQGEPWGAPVAPKQAPGEAKAQRDARAKLPSVDAALRRLERIEQASEKLTFGGGPVDAKVLGLTPSYKELEQAGASLMPVLTALTRVPGIGSQSDLEQRLAQLQIPSGDMYPETRKKAIAELKAFIEDLRAAYMNVAEGAAPPPSQSAAPTGGVKFLGFE